MIEWFELLERIIGHVAWPIAGYFIVRQFGDELRTFIKRIRNAKFQGVELNLEEEIKNIKSDAENLGITIAYPTSSYSEDTIRNIDAAPEWAFIKSWQEIESALYSYYSKVTGLKSKRASVSVILDHLSQSGAVEDDLIALIRKLNATRNSIVHSPASSVTRGEALEWLGISKSVKDRLIQRLS